MLRPSGQTYRLDSGMERPLPRWAAAVGGHSRPVEGQVWGCGGRATAVGTNVPPGICYRTLAHTMGCGCGGETIAHRKGGVGGRGGGALRPSAEAYRLVPAAKRTRGTALTEGCSGGRVRLGPLEARDGGGGASRCGQAGWVGGELDRGCAAEGRGMRACFCERHGDKVPSSPRGGAPSSSRYPPRCHRRLTIFPSTFSHQ